MENMSKFLYLIVWIIFTTLEISLVQANGHKQKFGDSCSKYRKCDFTKWLRCHQDGKCVCFQNNKVGKLDLYYDTVSERCVGRSGANCSQKFYPFDDDDTHHFFMRGTTTNHWRYGNGSLRCGANAFCDYDGKHHTCNCMQDYYETEDGLCQKLKGYGDHCINSTECDPDVYLQCIDELCSCAKDDDHVFEEASGKCVVKTGLPCETRINRLDKRVHDDCTADAFCETTNTPNVCRCHMGSQIHSDRTCKRGFGQQCDAQHPCGDSKLSCRSKVCQCKYPLHMKYDENTGQCVSIASGPCVFNNTSELAIQCVKYAECVKRGQLFSECKCKSGYLQTDDGDCVNVYGSDCEVDSDCDRVGPLACIDGHCKCPDLLLHYDPKTRKCKGAVGSRCRLDEDSCIERASCNKFEEVSAGKIGKCVCNRGYKEMVNNTCSN